MKHIALTLLMVLAIALTACGTSITGTPAGTNTDTGLSTISEIAAGTLKLSGTEQDVTADQAKELLILWKVYREVSQSSTSAQEEVEALIDQIQETMTSEQLQAITAMNITQQDIFTVMQSADVNSSTSVSTTTVSAPSGGGSGMPAGGPPDGGGTPPDGGTFPDDGGMATDGGAAPSGTDSTQNVELTSGIGGGAGVPSALIELVIQSLQAKVIS